MSQMKMFFLKGLPACGKSTKRRALLADLQLQPIVAVNKDEIRIELDIPPGNFFREPEVERIESERIKTVLTNKVENLVLDNTHNDPKYEVRYRAMAQHYGYEFVMIDMSDVPVAECIRRDSLREGQEKVGEKIIMSMYDKYYSPTRPKGKERKERKEKVKFVIPEPMVQDPSLPVAAIVDLDGTLSMANGRTWYEYTKADTDTLVVPVHATVKALVATGTIKHVIFLTGREETGREAALKFLDQTAGFPVDGTTNILVMKAKGDHRPDTEAKSELFDLHVRGKYNILMVFEDRNRVVEMWRQMGLTVFQVAMTSD